MMVGTGKGGPKDLATAAIHFQEACGGGDGRGCVTLATCTTRARGSPRTWCGPLRSSSRDARRGTSSRARRPPRCWSWAKAWAATCREPVAYLKKACDGGVASDCFHLATFYAKGQAGLERDMSAAVPLLKKACDGGHPEACFEVGFMTETGQGFPRTTKGPRPSTRNPATEAGRRLARKSVSDSERRRDRLRSSCVPAARVALVCGELRQRAVRETPERSARLRAGRGEARRPVEGRVHRPRLLAVPPACFQPDDKPEHRYVHGGNQWRCENHTASLAWDPGMGQGG